MKKISKLRDHHLVAGGGALQLDEVVLRAVGCEQGPGVLEVLAVGSHLVGAVSWAGG